MTCLHTILAPQAVAVAMPAVFRGTLDKDRSSWQELPDHGCHVRLRRIDDEGFVVERAPVVGGRRVDREAEPVEAPEAGFVTAASGLFGLLMQPK